MLNFHANPFSPFVTKVHYFLEEAGIPYKYHMTDLRASAGRVEIDKVSAFGKVPAIELDGFTLGESNAILRYLVERFDRHDYLPQNLEDRAQVDMVAEFMGNHVTSNVMKLAWNLTYAPKFGMGQPNETVVAAAREELVKSLPRIEKHLYGRHFLAGSTLSLADFMAWPFLAETPAAQLSLADFPSLQAYHERMSARPAWKKVAADVQQRLADVLKSRG